MDIGLHGGGFGGGAGVKLNIFNGLTEPTQKEGIWVKTDKPIKGYSEKIYEDTLQPFTHGVSEENSASGDMVISSGSQAALVGECVYIPATDAGLSRYNTKTKLWEKLNTPPYRLSETTTTAVGTDIYFVGGIDAQMQKSIYKYDTITGEWSKEPVTLPLELRQAKSVAHGTDIYVMGGYRYSSAIRDVFKYDTLTKTVTNLASLRYSSNNHYPLVVGDDIYVFGAQSSVPSDQKTTHKYNIPTDTWTMLAARTEASNYMVAVNKNDYIYLFNGSLTSYIQRYTISTDKWETLVSNAMMTTSYLIDAFVIGEKAYLFGVDTFKGVAKFDFKTERLDNYTRARFSSLDTSYLSFKYKNLILVQDIKRNSNTLTSSLRSYNIDTKEWGAWFTTPNNDLRGSVLVADGDGNLHVIGGKNSLRAHHFYNGATETWTVLPNTPFDFVEPFFTADDEYLYFLAGMNSSGYRYVNHYKYHPKTKTWTELPSYPADTTFKVDSIRGYFNVGKRLFITNSAGNHFYDKETNKWKTTTFIPPSEMLLNKQTTVAIGQDIYYLGADPTSSSSFKPKDTVAKFDTTTETLQYLGKIHTAISSSSAMWLESFGNDIMVLYQNSSFYEFYRLTINNYEFNESDADKLVFVKRGSAENFIDSKATIMSLPKNATKGLENFSMLKPKIYDAYFSQWVNNSKKFTPIYYGNGTQWVKLDN